MSLVRHWYPTGNYSYGNNQDILVIHTMEGFTGPNGAMDCIKYFQGNVGASSQVCIDNNRGHIWEGVSRSNASWTQCNENYRSLSCEQSGYASWSDSYWRSNRDNQLWNVAEWLAEESRATGIPLVESTSHGVTYHSRLGSYGCGHSDPGAGWPLGLVLERAKQFLSGGPTQPPKPEEPEEDEDEMPYLTVPANSSKPVCMSLNGFYSNIGLGVDASGIGNVSVRCAGHLGENRWTDAEVFGDAGHNKVVYQFKDSAGKVQKFDVIRVDRLDKTDCDLILNFGK